jgi:hypothetical protein
MDDKKIKLEVESNIDNLIKEVKLLNNNLEKTKDVVDDVDKEVKDVGKSVKSSEGSVKSLSDGFKGMGLAVKAIGIGIVIELFNLFKETLSKNQKVVDLFNTALGALEIAFNDLIGFVTKNLPTVVELFKDVFENPTKYLEKFNKLVKEYLIESFNSLLDTVGYLGSAIKELFLGNFDKALDSVKKAGKESIDILTGVNNSFDKGKKFVSDAASAISDYAVKTFKASEANIKLQNTALLAAAEQGRLVEQYDRQAEKLRQIRDNDLISISERIEANNKLKDVLDKQQKAMLAQADMQVAAARNTYNLNKTIENQVALTESLSNKEGVLAQVEGLRSEQISNNIALSKEALELDKSKAQGLNELAIAQQEFDADLNENELLKLEIKRENLEAEKAIELERLQFNIDSTKAGTQARVDAELEFATRKQEINNNITANEVALAEARKEIAAEEYAFKIGQAQQASATLSQLSELAGKETLAGKALGIASATINTYVGVSEALKQKSTLPSPFDVVAKVASVATVLATGFKAVKAITSVKVPGGGGGGAAPTPISVSGGAVATSAPSFNVVGTSGQNQIAQTLGNQAPVKAYVVSNDVTTAQSLDRNIVKTATLGN